MAWQDLSTLEKAKIFNGIATGIILPVTLVVVGHFFTTAIKSDDRELKFVELAIEILKQEPNEETKDLRVWAIDTIDLYSEIKLSPDARNNIENNRLLSSRVVADIVGYNEEATGNFVVIRGSQEIEPRILMPLHENDFIKFDSNKCADDLCQVDIRFRGAKAITRVDADYRFDASYEDLQTLFDIITKFPNKPSVNLMSR